MIGLIIVICAMIGITIYTIYKLSYHPNNISKQIYQAKDIYEYDSDSDEYISLRSRPPTTP